MDVWKKWQKFDGRKHYGKDIAADANKIEDTQLVQICAQNYRWQKYNRRRLERLSIVESKNDQPIKENNRTNTSVTHKY